MSKVTLYGADYTSLEKFVLKISSSEGDTYLNYNSDDDPSAPVGDDNTISLFVQWFAGVVLDYAFYSENSAIIKKVDNKEEYYLQDLYSKDGKGKRNLKKSDIFILDNNRLNGRLIGAVGYFRVSISKIFFQNMPEGLDKQQSDRIIDDIFPNDNEVYVTVILGSRFDMFEDVGPSREEAELDIDAKPYFLLRMLEAAFPEFHLQNSKAEGSMDCLWKYLYAQIFKNSLLSLYRLGFYREYVRFQKNDDRVKGKIDISRHIRLNGGKDNGRIAYSYRKKTEDNKLNHLIIKAYECLCKDDEYKEMMGEMLGENPDLKRIIQGLKIYAPSGEGKSESFLLGENNTPITSPYYQPYEKMRIICMKILRNSGASFLLDEDKNYVDGFLLYVPDLFEIYVLEGLKKALDDEKNRRYIIKDQSEFVINRPKENTDPFRPDYVLFEDKRPKAVLDAKYRPVYQSIFDGTRESPFFTDKDIKKDCRKLVRDISLLRVFEMETMLSISEKTIMPGIIIYPNNGEFKLNKEVIKKPENESTIDLSKWSKEHREKWEPEDVALKEMYLWSYRGNRKVSYEEAFNPVGKTIMYCGIPVCPINSDYRNWKKTQDKKCLDAIRNLYKEIKLSFVINQI